MENERYGCLLEPDVGVGNEESAEDSVHDRVERTGGERSDGKGDETDADGSNANISMPDIPLRLLVARRTSRKSSGNYPLRGEAREP